MMHTARKDQRLFGQLLFCADRGNAVRQNGAALRLCRVPTLFFESLGQYRIILSADTASEVRQLLSQKRR